MSTPTQSAAQSVGSPPVAGGLTSQEAEARLGQFGPNDPVPSKHQSAIVDFLRLFLNPLVLILLIAALLSAFLGDAADSAIITVIVLLSTALDFTQTYQSRRAIEQLRQQVAPTATVLRDAKWQEIRRSDVVPGDVVRLSAGDRPMRMAGLLYGHGCMRIGADSSVVAVASPHPPYLWHGGSVSSIESRCTTGSSGGAGPCTEDTQVRMLTGSTELFGRSLVFLPLLDARLFSRGSRHALGFGRADSMDSLPGGRTRSPAGAWLSSALIHRGYSIDRGRKIVMAPSALLAAMGAGVYFAPGQMLAIAIMAAALCGHQAWSSNLHTAISEISPSGESRIPAVFGHFSQGHAAALSTKRAESSPWRCLAPQEEPCS